MSSFLYVKFITIMIRMFIISYSYIIIYKKELIVIMILLLLLVL